MFNGNAAAFSVSQNGKSGAARFLFSTESGTIMGWSPAVNGKVALVGADRSATGAIYKGLAIANDKLYATDFHNGRIDVFDRSFNLVPGGFSDPKIPKGFAPFGIQALAGNIFVTYARQDTARKDDVAQPGAGYVDEFTPDGTLVGQVVNSQKKNAPLNAAWGLALAPGDFGVFAGNLLVGNFGNGRISAYAQRGTKWVYKGQLRHADGSSIEIDGLWAIAFGNGAAAGARIPTSSRPSGGRHGPLRVSDLRLGLAQEGRTGLGCEIPGPHWRTDALASGGSLDSRARGGRASISSIDPNPCWSSSIRRPASRRVCRGQVVPRTTPNANRARPPSRAKHARAAGRYDPHGRV